MVSESDNKNEDRNRPYMAERSLDGHWSYQDPERFGLPDMTEDRTWMETMSDKDLLKPSRDHLTMLRSEIDRQHELAARDIERYGYGSAEYADQRWREYHMSVAPIWREIEGVIKVMADYHALQQIPLMTISRS
jgi:hypothetical protein